MRWKGRRASTNVEDRRSASSGGGGSALGGGGARLLMMVVSKFGIKGVVVAVIGLFLVAKFTGINPLALLSGGGDASGGSAAAPAELTEKEEELTEFVSVVLAGTEDVWTSEFARHSQQYQKPTLVFYRRMTQTGGCGPGQAAMGPFYCPADQKVYIDLKFYDELAQAFNAPGDFAQAYVIAHEVGHHVQKLLGTSDKVSARRGKPDGNEMSVRLELQADFYAGVWAHHSKEYLERGDLEEAMRAANAIGDDAIQRKSQGKITPHAFTHGTSEQRMRWFKKGLESGKIEGGDTFSMPYTQL
jgi:predicted metalloprotease